MNQIPSRVARLVWRRAGERCEYCGLSQAGQEATFHIDHIVPQAAGGGHTENNLALACVSCSLRKGARQAGVDPESGAVVELFNPRQQRFNEHFEWRGVVLIGLSEVGRATISALDLNRPRVLKIREAEAAVGRHPPAAHSPAGG